MLLHLSIAKSPRDLTFSHVHRPLAQGALLFFAENSWLTSTKTNWLQDNIKCYDEIRLAKSGNDLALPKLVAPSSTCAAQASPRSFFFRSG